MYIPPFMDAVLSEEKVKKDSEMGGNIPGGNFLGGNFPRGSLMGGNFPGGDFPRTVRQGATEIAFHTFQFGKHSFQFSVRNWNYE